MRTLLLGLLAAVALALAGTAAAGGWATVGLAPPPDDIAAGSNWDARMTILQHGRTPLDNVQPTLTIRGDGGKTATFPAKPTGEPGVYVAAVKFPSAGSWSYRVDDGFSQTHDFAAVSVGGSSGSGFDLPSLPVTAGILLVLGAAIALVLGMRRLRPRPAPQL